MSEADAPRFTFRGYLAERWIALVALAVCEGGIAAMGTIMGLTRDGSAALCVFVGLVAASVLVLDFIRRRHFWKQASVMLEMMDETNQMQSFLDEPGFLEGRIAYAIAERMGDCGHAEMQSAQLEAAGYRDYIELWIHEAKTPIAAAKLILSRMQGEESDALSREVERIEDEVEQALYYARSTSVRSDYAIREVNLGEAVREACKRHARFLIERQAIPSIRIPTDATVLADRPWLVFMVGQVVVNAAQYGAHTISFVSTEEGVGTSREHTVLEVADDGCGIPAEDVPRVFDRGFTGRNGRARGSATGMGLHLVASMCEQLGVGVRLASEEGIGTRVIFTFPHDRRRAHVTGM